MFEIGNSLRHARERRQLSLEDVERALKIRTRYLAALEEERFEVLPGEAYTKGFLRTYAEYLGLDSQLFVDEYNGRLEQEDEEEPVVIAPAPRISVPHLDARPRTVAFVAAVVLVPLVLGVAAWRIASSGSAPTNSPPAAAVPPGSSAKPAAAEAPHAKRERPAASGAVTLVLRASGGDSWVLARSGSPDGRLLYERTLASGDAVRLHGTRIWLRLGAPWNLDARLDGKRLALPGQVADVVVSARGVRRVG
jgi:cytoskeletal protein RodZ